MNNFDDYSQDDKIYEENDVTIHEPRREYYYETIKETRPERKQTSWRKFILGIVLASVIGGSAVGASFSFIQPFAKQFIENRYGFGDTIKEEEKVEFKFDDGATNVVTTIDNNSSKSPVVQIAKSVGPSVVSITPTTTGVDYWNREFISQGLGSGVIFNVSDDKVYIITNSHVVEEATTLTVNFLGNTKVPAQLVGRDSTSDIAVVSVNKNEIPDSIRDSIKPAPMGNSDELEVGELAVAIGNPIDESYHNTVTAGVISALDREISLPDKKLNLIQTDAAINPGNSGGALVGSAGTVIGINTVKLVDSKIEGMGFAIPINDVKPIVEELMNKGTVARPYLGITGADVTEETAAFLDFPIGIYVQDVMPGSGAYAAGIQKGDIIIEFDGVKISSMEKLSSIIRSHKPNDVVSLKLVRGSQKKELKVTLLQQPSATAR